MFLTPVFSGERAFFCIFCCGIVSVADVYDALTSDRPYHKAMSPYVAEEIIVKGSGTEFDPEVVQAFVKAFKRGDMDVSGLIV